MGLRGKELGLLGARRRARLALAGVLVALGLISPSIAAATAHGRSVAAQASCPSGSVQLASGTYGGGDDTGENVCVPSGSQVVLAGGESWNTLVVDGSIRVGNANSCGSSGPYGITLADGGAIAAGAELALWSSSSCDEGGPTSLTISQGKLSNAGTLAAILTSSCGSTPCSFGGGRSITGSVTNTGTLEIPDGELLTVNGPGLLDNQGTVSITSGQQITLSGGESFTNGSGGTITTDANSSTQLVEDGGTFTEAGAIDSASNPDPVLLAGANLDYTGSGTGTIEVQGETTLSGSIDKSQTLALFGSSGFCNFASAANVTAPTGFTNAGTISGVCGGGPVSLSVSSGRLLNTGTIDTDPASLNLSGNVTNAGTVSVDSGETDTYQGGSFLNGGALDITSSGATFSVPGGAGALFANGAAGSITNAGSFTVGSGNTFAEAGKITVSSGGTAPVLDADTLDYTGAGAGTIEVLGNTTLSGNIAAHQTLELEGGSGFCQIASASVTAAAGFTNAGTIDTACGGGPVTLTVSSGVLTNTGTIATSPSVINVDAAVDNQGLLQAGYNSSLTVSSLTNYDASTQTLTGGAYYADSTSNCSGIVVPGMDVATNDATIVINGGCPPLSDGSGSSLANLTDNQGTLDIGRSANEAINLSGSLTNSGTIALGEDNDIHLNGSYSQTSAGTLATIIGGTRATYTYGQLEVGGSASFAGKLAIIKDPAYTPAAGDTQQIVTYGSQTGQFTSVTGTSAGSLHFVLQYTPTAAELVATATRLSAAPSSGAPGATVTLNGQGFSPGETVSLGFKDSAGTVTSLPNATANSAGAFTASEAIPAGAAAGAGKFVARGQTSDTTAAAAFTVT